MSNEELLNQIETTIKQLGKVKIALEELQKEYINQIEKNEELEYEIEILKEKIEIIERDRDDNYRPIPISEQLDISDRDFI